jgi:hypothetical protein
MGVSHRKQQDLKLYLYLATPAPFPDQLRPTNPAEEALERTGHQRPTLKPCSKWRGEKGGNELLDKFLLYAIVIIDDNCCSTALVLLDLRVSITYNRLY